MWSEKYWTRYSQYKTSEFTRKYMDYRYRLIKLISIYFLEQEVLITNFGVWPYLVQFWLGKHWGFGTASWTLSDYVGLAMYDPIIHGLVPSTLIWNFFGLEQKKSTDDHTNVAHIQLDCTQTFFYFSFWKHWWEWAWSTGTSAEHEKEK